MNKKETIETQLDCKATATLRESIEDDLQQEDKPIAGLLQKEDNEDEPVSSN